MKDQKRITITVREETYRLIEKLSKAFKEAGLRYSKSYVIDIATKIALAVLLGEKFADVNFIVDKFIEKEVNEGLRK